LVRLPACAATTPEVAACTAEPVVLDAVNDPRAMVVSAQVEVAGDAVPGAGAYDLGLGDFGSGATFALMSLTSDGTTGDYSASDLKRVCQLNGVTGSCG